MEVIEQQKPSPADNGQEQMRRRKRSTSAKILSRSERSAELGVKSGYEVVSEVDLAFTPDGREEKVAVLKVRRGKLYENITRSGRKSPARRTVILHWLKELAKIDS